MDNHWIFTLKPLVIMAGDAIVPKARRVYNVDERILDVVIHNTSATMVEHVFQVLAIGLEIYKTFVIVEMP